VVPKNLKKSQFKLLATPGAIVLIGTRLTANSAGWSPFAEGTLGVANCEGSIYWSRAAFVGSETPFFVLGT
jgi:hypothetical protein